MIFVVVLCDSMGMEIMLGDMCGVVKRNFSFNSLEFFFFQLLYKIFVPFSMQQSWEMTKKPLKQLCNLKTNKSKRLNVRSR